MAITYPLTIPSIPTPTRITMKPRFAVGSARSPYTFQGEYFEHMGQMWVAEIEMPSMYRELGEQWVSWGLSLNGMLGTFLMGDPSGTTARGGLGGTPVVDGAGQQRSKTLATRGWTPSTLVLKSGDYIQIGTGSSAELHKNLTDATSDGSGDLTLDVFPRIRNSLSDGASIITSNTVGLWRMADNEFIWDNDTVFYGFAFTAVEAL